MNDRSSITSLSLLRRVWANEPGGWTAFVDKYALLVYRWCRHAGLNAHDAHDVAQDVFMSVARKFDQFHHEQSRGGLKNWLFTITKNKLADFRRRSRRQVSSPGGSAWRSLMDSIAFSAPSGTNSMEPRGEAEVDAAVARVRNEVGERDWNLFHRTVVDGEKPADVAVQNSVSVNMVYLARSRILKRLREACRHLTQGGPER